MVDTVGHVGMALVWLAPVWLFVDRPGMAGLVVATSAPFGTLPDVDVYLVQLVEGVHHHGVTHTLVFVTLVSAVVGPALGYLVWRTLGNVAWFTPTGPRDAATVWWITVAVAMLSHLFADMLSAPDISTRIEPLWPVVGGPIVHIDVLWYSSVRATWGIFTVGVLLNLALFLVTNRRTGSPS